MGKRNEVGCRYTVGEGVSEAVKQLGVWGKATKKTARAYAAAACAADVITQIWELLDDQTRARLDANLSLRERIRAVIDFYGIAAV